MSYVVTGPLVITRNEDGSQRYIYAGGELPDYLSDDEVAHLASTGLVEKVGSSPRSAAKKSDES